MSSLNVGCLYEPFGTYSRRYFSSFLSTLEMVSHPNINLVANSRKVNELATRI